MGLNIRFDAKAVSDLADVRNYLVERSPQGAERVRLHILGAIDRLTEFPFLGRPTDAPDVRVLVLTRYPYLIFYAVAGPDVVILHIRHASRSPFEPPEF